MRLFNKVISMVLFVALLITMSVVSAFAPEDEAHGLDVNDIESLETEADAEVEAEPESEEIPDPEVPLAGIPPIGETTESQSGLNHALFYMIIGGIAIIILDTFAPTIISKIRKSPK